MPRRCGIDQKKDFRRNCCNCKQQRKQQLQECNSKRDAVSLTPSNFSSTLIFFLDSENQQRKLTQTRLQDEILNSLPKLKTKQPSPNDHLHLLPSKTCPSIHDLLLLTPLPNPNLNLRPYLSSLRPLHNVSHAHGQQSP